jgi:PPK2 family polyphosphate:nucleotide phosphotransferase
MAKKLSIDHFRVEPGGKVRLSKHDTGWAQTKELRELGKGATRERAAKLLDENRKHLFTAQQLLYADDRYSVLVVLQALDAAGKDGTIKHVMSGLNPQGCQVFSFKQPSKEELEHNFLWRYSRCLPERGHIGIFNRSYYEDVLVVKVHPEILDAQKLPPGKKNKDFWEARYDDINAFERHLTRNGTILVKIFLNVSRDEQKRRFLERLERPEKHWKFSPADLKERGFWDDYMKAYDEMFAATSTKQAPWYIVPADHKWATRAVVAEILATTIDGLDLEYPKISADQRRALAEAKDRLLAEK